MKHALRLTALLAAVMMMAACHKENVETATPVVGNERDITYTVAEQTTTVHLKSDAEFDALLDRFCTFAQEGSAVTFYNANRGSKGIAAKDVATYSTTNREEMKRWMREQEDAGRTVTVTYDPNTGTYNGRAYTSAPTPDPGPAPFNSTYVPLSELLTGEWEQVADTMGWFDQTKLSDLWQSLNVSNGLGASNLFIQPELSWRSLLNTVAGFTHEAPSRKAHLTFENGVMHVDLVEYQYTYDEYNNIIGIDTVPSSILTDFTIEQENECRIHFTPLNPDNWWPINPSHPEFFNKLVICSLDRNRLIIFLDQYFSGVDMTPQVSLYRRVR